MPNGIGLRPYGIGTQPTFGICGTASPRHPTGYMKPAAAGLSQTLRAYTDYANHQNNIIACLPIPFGNGNCNITAQNISIYCLTESDFFAY